MKRALLVAVVLVVLVWVALHPTLSPDICYGVMLNPAYRYHYAPIPCGMWPLN